MQYRKRQNEPNQNFSLYVFECVMAILYLSFSIALLFTDILSGSINSSFRLPLGILLGAYGIFRVYRAIRKYLLQKRQNETFKD